jgi:hypothetical protein
MFPSINKFESVDEEVGIFAFFLHSKDFPQHRNLIFGAYPELKDRLSGLDEKAEREELKRFVIEVRNKYQSEIKSAVEYIRKEVESKGSTSLEILGRLMNYTWHTSDKSKYVLIPSMYPTCPFNKNKFFYSITNVRKGKVIYDDVIPVSMHEISHFILFDILAEKNIKLKPKMLYFIKEIIAPIIVNQDEFSDIFSKRIVGNTNVLEIFFSGDGKTIKAFDYFNSKYIDNKNAGDDFRVFLDDMIGICLRVEKEIEDKHEFWNKHGNIIKNDPELMEIFRKPIAIS